jgi:hypothetical protein
MNQWLFDTLEAFIATLVKTRDTLLLRKPAEAVALPISVTTMPENNVDTLVPWTGKENCRHNVRVLCDLEGLTVAQKEDMSSTVNCESGYNPNICNLNFTDGTTAECLYPDIQSAIASHVAQGKKVASIDYGIAQINDYYHIGEGKDFSSAEAVIQNPEPVIRWMAKQWIAGNGRLWVCKLRNMNVNYSS